MSYTDVLYDPSLEGEREVTDPPPLLGERAG